MSAKEKADGVDRLLSRRLFIGLGQYGGLVVDQIRNRITRKPKEENQLTQVLHFEAASLTLSAGKALTRRQSHEMFLQKDCLSLAFRQIDNAVAACARMPEMAVNQPRVDECICVFLIGDLADPFAGSTALEIARLVGAAARGRMRSVIGLFSLGLMLEGQASDAGADRRDGEANVCAALRELEYARAKGLTELPQFGDPVPDVPAGRTLDQCLLLTEANPCGAVRDLQEHAHLVARFLMRCCQGEFLRRLVEFPEEVQDRVQAPNRPLFGSFGLASVYFPRLDVYAYCMERWVRDVETMLGLEQSPQAPPVLAAVESLRAALPQSSETIASAFLQHELNLPDVSVAGSPPASLHAAATAYAGILADLEKAATATQIPSNLANWARDKVVVPTTARCRAAVDGLLKGNLSGIGLAESYLNHLCGAASAAEALGEAPLLTGLLDACSRQANQCRRTFENALTRCRRGLKPILESPSDTPVPLRPLFLIHPVQYLRIRQQERRLADSIAQWHEEVAAVRGAACNLLGAVYAQRVIESLIAAVRKEKSALVELVQKLQEASSIIGQKYRAIVPHSLGVDRPIIPSDCYETIYAQCIREAAAADLNAAMRRLIVDQRLLAGFREVTAERLAGAIESAGREFFDQVKKMGIDSVLADGCYARYLPDSNDVLAGLMNLAEPLIDTRGTPQPEGWHPGSLIAIWLPDPERLSVYGPSLASAELNLQINQGSATGIHLCKITHGFTVPNIARLRAFVSSYLSRPDKAELHIFAWSDRLPSLPDTN